MAVTDATPESDVYGSVGDIVIDGTGDVVYFKAGGDDTATGWKSLVGRAEFQAIVATATDFADLKAQIAAWAP